MKTTQKLGLVSLLFLTQAAFASHNPLSGTYNVVPSDGCNQLTGVLDNTPITVRATESALEMNNPVSGKTEFEVGHYNADPCPTDGSFCFGIISTFLDGSYSADRTHFTAIETSVDNSSQSAPQYAGQYDVSIAGTVLTFTTTANEQPTPVARITCLMNKVN